MVADNSGDCEDNRGANMDGLQKVIETYYNCIRKNKMKLEEIPERYRKLVEVYYNEMEKKNVNS